MKTVKSIETAKGKLIYTLFSEENNGTETYGITVMSTVFGENESSTVKDITSRREFAEKFLYILADNLVLPSTLSEVTEEYVTAEFTVL